MEISSVTHYDKLITEVSFALMSGELKKFDCFSCVKGKNHEAAKRTYGCVEAKDSHVFVSDEYKFYKCVGNYRDINFGKFVRYSELIKKSINPFGGPFIETPAKLVELCSLIDNLITEKNIKEASKR
jgi:hypothetical protein